MTLCSRAVLVCLCIVAVASNDEDSRTIATMQGRVKGHRDPEGGLYAFYGIPYASAPTGSQKFKAPLPAPMWLDILEAVDKQIICPQPKTEFTESMTMQEDCLIVNVFVPDTKETKLPVVVYVHGGAFQIGYGNLMTPKHFARTKNVIAVTFNYRLGAHGFLCLGTDDAPGNAGMKDQVAALLWVQKNIMKFGGNTEDVTIAGYSAGATSVDLLAISSSAKGLFNKVILDSGSNLMAGGVVANPLNNAKIFAASFGFTDLDDVYALENFYKTASFDSLTKGGFMDRPNSTLLFAPCVERDTKGAFITDAPFNILEKNKYTKVPMLYGFTNMEGLFRAPLFDTWKTKMSATFSDFLPGDLFFESEQEREEVARDVKEFYFGDEPINEKNIRHYIEYFGDVIFKYPVLRSVIMHVDNGNDKVYLYEYSFVDDDVPVVPNTDVRGATHCAQTAAVLDGRNKTEKSEDHISEEYKKVKATIRELWSNFIKTGMPVPADSNLPAWPAANAEGLPYMDITVLLQLRADSLPLNTHYWNDLYSRHYRVPVPPPQPPVRHSEL